MKKIILASVVAAGAIASGHANATAICTGVSPAAAATANPGIVSGTDFARTAFTPKCSANVFLKADNGVTYFRVGSASAKGSRSFMGSSAGGSVTSSVTCVACTAADAAAAATIATNLTSG